MQKYEKAVQEDLNLGTEQVWTTAPGGGELRATQVGIHSLAVGQQAWEATWAPGAIAAAGNASTTVTVTGAAVGDFVMASHDKMLTNGLRILGHVSAADTVTVVMHNPTAASITVASGTVRVLVFSAIDDVPAMAAHFSWTSNFNKVEFTDTSTGSPTTWSWDFGDLNTSEQQNPLNTYAEQNIYTVTLTITGPGGTDDVSTSVDCTPDSNSGSI